MKTSTKWLVGAFIWTALGLLAASQRLAAFMYAGRAVPVTAIYGRTMLDWYTCALFTPLIFWVARTFRLDSPRWAAMVPVHIVACAAFVVLKLALFIPLANAAGWVDEPVRFLSWITADGFPLTLSYIIVVAVRYALDYYERYRERLVEAERLQSRLAHVQLDALRAQLHPHFLFNALNALSTLIHRDPAAADRMVVELGELLRETISTDGAAEVPLHTELRFIERYLSIMQIRLGERLRVTVDVDDDVRDALVPHMLLQPIVENALVHGIGRSTAAGELIVRGHREDGMVVLEVLDDGPGIQNGGNGERIGLRNTRLLLEQLYQQRQSLALENRATGGALTRVTLPYREAV